MATAGATVPRGVVDGGLAGGELVGTACLVACGTAVPVGIAVLVISGTDVSVTKANGGAVGASVGRASAGSRAVQATVAKPGSNTNRNQDNAALHGFNLALLGWNGINGCPDSWLRKIVAWKERNVEQLGNRRNFVIIFSNTALVGAAMIRLKGGDPTVGDGFCLALERIGHIFGYAVIAATVGVILRWLQEKAMVGRIAAGFIGLAWNLATFLKGLSRFTFHASPPQSSLLSATRPPLPIPCSAPPASETRGGRAAATR